ncbi:MAG: T9SS type A sorting domain-containing protein [Edaphocola sp.]
MKRIFTLLAVTLFLNEATAQDKGFVHIATAGNTVSNRTYIDHPDLNGNPSAKFLFSQHYNGIENPNPTGIWYNSGTSKWAIFNENLVDMPAGIQFNIYIPDDSPATIHVADTSNILEHQTALSGYNQTDYLFYNNYWNANNVYNPFVYGNYYNGANRLLYGESLHYVPDGSAFFVMLGSDGSATRFSQASNSSNIIVGGSMRIDHPSLNNNPDAVFLYSHYWGYPTGENTTYLPYVTDVDYRNGYWYVYAYSADSFPANVWFDFIVPDLTLGIEEQPFKMDKIQIYPNPAVDWVYFKSKAEIKEVEIYDGAGKLLLLSKCTGTDLQMDVSSLPAGIYLAKIKTQKGWDSQKLIKK